MPSGLWTAVNGALRPGVEALAAHLVLVAHLVGAGALVTIAPTLCAHAGTTINMDVHYIQPRDEGAADAGAKTPCNCQGP